MSTNMTRSSIKGINSNYANAIDSLSKGEKYTRSIDGAMGIITKYWNKGYGDSAKSLLGVERPKELRALIRKYAKMEGVDSRMIAVVKDTKGNESTVIGVWGTKKMENEDVTIQDAKGKDTHPYVMTKDAKGKDVVFSVDSLKPVTSWTPGIIFDIIMQNMALANGEKTPYTAEDFMREYDIDDTNHAVAKEVPALPCPPAAKGALEEVA